MVDGSKLYYNQFTNKIEKIPDLEKVITLSNLNKNAVVWQNHEASILDIGDGIINVSFHSKMNTIGSEISSFKPRH